MHSVAYSLLLLNTDLHVAELSSRMSRSQFVRNTLATIQLQLQPGSSSDLTYDDWSSVRAGSDVSDGPVVRTIKRSDSMTSWSSVTREAFVSNLGSRAASSGQLTSASTDTSGTQPVTPVNESALSVASVREAKSPESVSSPVVYDRNWEGEMESMLKVSVWNRYLCPFLMDNITGDIQRRQGPTDSPAHRKYDAGANVHFISRSTWACSQEAQLAWTAE